MKYLVIKRKDGSVSTVRYECESASEKSLTYEEEIIKELYHKNEELEETNRKQAFAINVIEKMRLELEHHIEELELGYKVILDDIDFGYDIEMIKNKIVHGNYNNIVYSIRI